VFASLLDNALKFTRPRECAEIEIGARKERDEHIFFVRDNGVGFDPRHADKLFGVFQRLHTGAEFEGTGIGLASVRRIIQRHNGRSWAESVSGKGTVVYVSLPIQDTANEPLH
jgi:light-regulated signal transduction histidine kinase (bacteriophytochrome)